MNKPDLASNNILWLICHKTKPNPTILPQAECDTRSIFKWNTTGLDSGFSFSGGCLGFMAYQPW